MTTKERPILFNGPMVRAILEGRKTQTRRIVKFTEFGVSDTPGYQWHFRGTRKGGKGGLWQDMRHEQILDLCPYGKPGDRLWVRETFRIYDSADQCSCYDMCNCSQYNGKPIFRADGEDTEVGWRPSIHMPRWASRITLEIIGVRVERLHDIDEADAAAEGIRFDSGLMGPWEGHATARDAFRSLWGSINGPNSWTANPLAWVVEFKKAEAAK